MADDVPVTVFVEIPTGSRNTYEGALRVIREARRAARDRTPRQWDEVSVESGQKLREGIDWWHGVGRFVPPVEVVPASPPG